jgi:hypothetical protein
LGYRLEVELKRFIDGLDVECEEREIWRLPRVWFGFALSNSVDVAVLQR